MCILNVSKQMLGMYSNLKTVRMLFQWNKTDVLNIDCWLIGHYVQ